VLRYSQIHRELVERTTAIERDQTIGFFAIVPENGLQQHSNQLKREQKPQVPIEDK
jgi:hypothetical protein